MGCKVCGMVYSLVFGIQFHKAGCAVARAAYQTSRNLHEVEAKLERAAEILDETGAHDAARQVRAIRA